MAEDLQSKRISKLYTGLSLGLCFLVPALVMLLAMAAFGMAPFGDRSTLIMDMSGQYVEFFCGLKQVLRDGNFTSLFFSWSKSMGGNGVGVFAYYVSSPLSWLTLFVPNNAMPIGLLFLSILKIGLCGLTMGIFLHNMGFKNNIAAVLFATAYGLMSYNIVYAMCPMWIDGVIWLPIILLGVEQLLGKNRITLLTVSLFTVFISNYYIAYMVGAFTALWFVYRVGACYWGTFSGKMLLKRLGKFALSVFTAAGLGAWLLLPTLFSLMQGKIGGSGMQASGVWNFGGQALWDKFFVGGYDSITNAGSPFVYCGLALALLCIAYFSIKTIPVQERYFSACLLTFLILSLASVKLDLAWHIFQYPNWFPYRYGFVVTFFVIYLAARGFQHIRNLNLGMVVAGLFLLVLSGSPWVGYCYLLIFLLVRMLKNRWGPLPRSAAGIFCVLLIFVNAYEMYYNTGSLLEGQDREFHYESYEAYHTYKSNVEGVLAIIEQDIGDNAYTAVAPHYVRTINDPYGFGYRSISHYSSAYNRTTNDFYKSLGYAQSWFWSLHFGGTAISDSLFGVGYTVNDPEARTSSFNARLEVGSTVPDNQYEVIGTYAGATVYKNQYAITAPFVVSKNLLTTKIEGDYFTAQNALLSGMLGTQTDCLQTLDKSAVRIEDDTISITAPKDGVLYVYFARDTGRTMTVNNTYTVDLFRGETDCIQSLGFYKAGEVATITVRGAQGLVDNYWTRFAILDTAQLEMATDTLRAGSMQNFHAENGALSGRVNCGEDGLLFTSIPYDEGWRVWVDGKRVETTAFSDSLLCVELSAGTHFVEMQYVAKGADLGLGISVLTVCVLLAVPGVKWLKKRKIYDPAR
ncbi:MAG: YfhO family protein [Clostridia bacterium]|nr:YfhO family protein [Clostridia bacterium]